MSNCVLFKLNLSKNKKLVICCCSDGDKRKPSNVSKEINKREATEGKKIEEKKRDKKARKERKNEREKTEE